MQVSETSLKIGVFFTKSPCSPILPTKWGLKIVKILKDVLGKAVYLNHRERDINI